MKLAIKSTDFVMYPAILDVFIPNIEGPVDEKKKVCFLVFLDGAIEHRNVSVHMCSGLKGKLFQRVSDFFKHQCLSYGTS